MLVPPNRITHGPAINRGLDCTLSQFTGELTDALPVVERRRVGVASIESYPPSSADRTRVWVDYRGAGH